MIKIEGDDRKLRLASAIIELQFDVAMNRNLLAVLCQGDSIDRDQWYKCAELARRELENTYGEKLKLSRVISEDES